MGDQVHAEVQRLRQLGLVDRLIIVALPKLAATQVEALLEELRVQDPTIARTILNVALDAAERFAAAQRYLREFHRVVAQLKTLDPSIARTIANVTFMARMPTRTAKLDYKRFAQLLSTFHHDVAFARTVAKTACRSADPSASRSE
jgi:CelD/BcsL family acetyltransferase involved in cellulose biosynthesis